MTNVLKHLQMYKNFLSPHHYFTPQIKIITLFDES